MYSFKNNKKMEEEKIVEAEVVEEKITSMPPDSSSSPKPQETATTLHLTFPEAIKEVIAGKKISKLEWPSREYYGFLNGDILSLHKPDGKNYQWVINMGDLAGTDWVVL